MVFIRKKEGDLMETYDTSMAARFTDLLTQREAELSAILDLASNHPGETLEANQRDVQDFKDVAIEQSRAVVDEAQAEHAAHELEQVLAARQRLVEGTYGICLDCGEDIDLRRLAALPSTPYCTACQAIREHAGAGRR